MKMKPAIRMAAVVSVVALLSTGCSLINKKESGQSIDPPPSGAESMMETASVPVSAENGRQVTLYFKDSKGLVAPVSVYVPKTVEVAKKSLQYMVEGTDSASVLPKGFTALLPKGTTVKGIDIKPDQKLATVDFSKEFTQYKPEDERKVLEAVVWTLTGIDNVDKVSIRVEGKQLNQMPTAKTPVDNEMTRAMGINLEFTEGLNLGQSVPVTLYFKEQSEQLSYYVPVTRLVPRTEDVAKAAVEQLIKGPDANKGLAAVMSADTGLLQVKLSDDKSLVTVNFNEKLLGSDKKVPADAAQALILSLTETTGASKVQLMVNNDVKVAGTDNTNYSKPVAAPAHVNPVKL